MSQNETSTVPMPSSSSPELTSVKRFSRIPLVEFAINYVDQQCNTLTPTPYATVKNISGSVIALSQPILSIASPIVSFADSIGNRALDIAEHQAPVCFQLKPEQVSEYVQSQKENVSGLVRNRADSVTKAIDGVGKGIDGRCAPVVNVFEKVVKRLDSEGKPTSPVQSEYQYQRAIALSRDLRENIYHLSAAQWNQIQTQSVLVQTLNERAQALTNAASSAASSAQVQLNEGYKQVQSEMQKLQKVTNDISASISSNMQIPPSIHQAYNESSARLEQTISVLRERAMSDQPLQAKAQAVAADVQKVLAQLRDALAGWTRPQEKPTVNGVNGQ
ncbi:hypothetical protein C8J56DRAFT_283360 [Mycena floridula]|nr:hypothetical protein C8J56DRAFT_283360 [Mycena floridula]